MTNPEMISVQRTALDVAAITSVAAIDVAAMTHFLDEQGVIEAGWIQEWWGIDQSTSAAVGSTLSAGIVAATESTATWLTDRQYETAARWTRRGGVALAATASLGAHVAIELNASDLSDPKDTAGALFGIVLGVFAGRGLSRAVRSLRS